MVKIMQSQQRKLSRHNSRQSSIGETASLGSAKSAKSSSSLNANEQQTKKSTAASLSKHGSQEDANSPNHQPANILNVAEMLLHGVADNEILAIWLRSIQCEEFVVKFIESGYDMPTISRITPQDLTAIGVTEPTKRLKILTEIKKLNLQDGIPTFRPVDLRHWLGLLRLDSYYYKSLCDQQVDTLEKVCQLTWEDFEELGIAKLGHQKRFQLAIERLKELDSSNTNSSNKKGPISEPIYDTNPSQILLVASAENHIMNGPIINKQSSTSELSSTGSGSLHSVYSAASTHYQPSSYTPSSSTHLPQSTPLLPPDNQPNQLNQLVNQSQNGQIHITQQQQKQAFHSQPPAPPPPLIYQQLPGMPVEHQQSHYQAIAQQQKSPASLSNGQTHLEAIPNGGSIQVRQQQQQQSQQQNRQSMLPFSALAKLPLHQQQFLQQSSIYATLSRQPYKAKQPPPPVPIRTNSLKCNSLTDDINNRQPQHQQSNSQSQTNNCHTNSASTLFGNSTDRTPTRRQFNSQTMTLTKNKSFSGNAHMEASRAKFLNRNSHQQPSLHQFYPQSIQQTTMNHNNGDQNNFNNQNLIYGTLVNQSNAETESGNLNSPTNSHHLVSGNNGIHISIMPESATSLSHQGYPNQNQSKSQLTLMNGVSMYRQGEDLDPLSDTTSTKSLIMPSSNNMIGSQTNNNGQLSQSSPSHGSGSGSSQTLYNSASSGSNDLNLCNFGNQASGDSRQHQPLLSGLSTTASSCTLNDANNLTLDHQQLHTNLDPVANGGRIAGGDPGLHYGATTGKDDNFPPPPSPLSLTDSDEHDLVLIDGNNGNENNNFTDIGHRLMTFRVGN